MDSAVTGRLGGGVSDCISEEGVAQMMAVQICHLPDGHAEQHNGQDDPK